MKQQWNLQRRITTAFAGLALLASASLGLAQNTNPTNTFDNADSTKSFVQWWGGGGAGATMTWDETLDAAGDAASGSVRYEANFVGNSGEQFMTFFTIANRWGWDGGYILDATTYTNLSFDIRVDPASGQRKANNDFGWLEVGLVTDGWGTTYLPGRAIPLSAQGTWTHFNYPMDATLANIDKVVGFFIKMWSDGGHTNSLIFNVDNFMITKPTAPVIIPPPTVAIKKPGPSGVQIIMNDDSAQWQRHAIATPAATGPYMWTSQGSYPVSYSFTIADFPDMISHRGFEAHIYIANEDTAPANSATSGSPDWGVPDIFIFRVENVRNTILTTNTDTTITTNYTYNAMAQIQWKTNYPNANATNIPVLVYPPSVLGTWTVTFTDGTHGSLSGPGITTTNFTLPEDAVLSNFSPSSSFVQFGVFKNDGGNDGHNNQASGTFSHVKFTGAAAPFDDEFSGPTLTNKYEWRKTSTTAVQFVPQGTAWRVDWTLPASGFRLQTKANLESGTWTSLSLGGYDSGGSHHVLVPKTELPSTDASFFRLIKGAYSKLLVLLPGETAAPGTLTGKTGTPTDVQIGALFSFDVKAVDADWFPVTAGVTNTVHLSTTDASAFLNAVGPATDVSLSYGAITVGNNWFGTEGSWTIKAEDVTDPTKTSNTSGPIKVIP